MVNKTSKRTKFIKVNVSISVGQDVCRSCDNIHGVLGSLSHLLHLLVPRPQHYQDSLHQPHLLGFLLVGDVQHMRQPNHLLLDEQKV